MPWNRVENKSIFFRMGITLKTVLIFNLSNSVLHLPLTGSSDSRTTHYSFSTKNETHRCHALASIIGALIFLTSSLRSLINASAVLIFPSRFSFPSRIEGELMPGMTDWGQRAKETAERRRYWATTRDWSWLSWSEGGVGHGRHCSGLRPFVLSIKLWMFSNQLVFGTKFK